MDEKENYCMITWDFSLFLANRKQKPNSLNYCTKRKTPIKLDLLVVNTYLYFLNIACFLS